MTQIKGRGADCALFVAAAMQKTGFLGEIPRQEYSRDWHLHENSSLVLESYFIGIRNCREGLVFELMDGCPEHCLRGDMFLMSCVPSGIIHHAGICINEHSMIHSIQRQGVKIVPFKGWWRRHVKKTARLMEKE